MKSKYSVLCAFLSLLMIFNRNIQGKEFQYKHETDENINYEIKKYLPFTLPPLAFITGYFVYNKIKDNNKNAPNSNQLKPLYTKKLNKITLRIIKHGDTNTGILIANTKDDPFLVKDANANDLATAIVSPNNQACRDGALAGAIENMGGKDVQEDKQKWIQEGKNNNLGMDNYTGDSIAIKYGEAKLGKCGNFVNLKNIIHTVGPYVASGVPSLEHEEQLKNSYINSCKIAAKNAIQRIVFPPISLGVFNFPSDKGTEISIQSIKDFSKEDTGSLEYIDIWMIDDGKNYPFLVAAEKILGVSD